MWDTHGKVIVYGGMSVAESKAPTKRAGAIATALLEDGFRPTHRLTSPMREAFETVIGLAEQSALDPDNYDEGDDEYEEAKRHQAALDAIKTYIRTNTLPRLRFHLIFPEEKIITADDVVDMFAEKLQLAQIPDEHMAAETPLEMAKGLEAQGAITVLKVEDLDA